MKRGLILLLLFFFCSAQTFGFELVLPSEKKNYVNSDYAFFYGRAKNGESISINDEGISTASNGAFAYTFKLKEGENRIKFKSNYGVQFFKFYKTTPEKQELPIENFEPTKAYVNSDNTPLRSTPVDAGMNRIGHLFANTSIIINGSQGSFYRVFLSKDKEGWIAKDSVTINKLGFRNSSEFISMDSQRYKNAMVQTISFTNTLPYTVEDTEKEIIFRVYNPEISDSSVYTLNIPKPEKYTYSVTSECGKYTFKVKQLPANISDITVVVDAGHGGSERGAIGCLKDEEKDINLAIAAELSKQLRDKGFNVVMTRECDANLSLNDRVQIAKENDADIFVSIHLNSIGGNTPMDIHKTRGTGVYYYNSNSKRLAEIIEKRVSSSAGTRGDGIHEASFAVVRPTEYVGVLVECAYMTNPLDSVLYRNDNFAKKVAKGITKGLVEFVNEK